MAKTQKTKIPAEAAAIMARMVKMPPKPHEDMKVGRPAQHRTAKPKESSQNDSALKGKERAPKKDA